MKILNLLMWVGQFGLSVIFPTVFFLYLAVWLTNRFGLGMWILIPFALIGILTSVSTTKSCIRSIIKAANAITEDKPEPPIAFNDHH